MGGALTRISTRSFLHSFPSPIRARFSAHFLKTFSSRVREVTSLTTHLNTHLTTHLTGGRRRRGLGGGGPGGGRRGRRRRRGRRGRGRGWRWRAGCEPPCTPPPPSSHASHSPNPPTPLRLRGEGGGEGGRGRAFQRNRPWQRREREEGGRVQGGRKGGRAHRRSQRVAGSARAEPMSHLPEDRAGPGRVGCRGRARTRAVPRAHTHTHTGGTQTRTHKAHSAISRGLALAHAARRAGNARRQAPGRFNGGLGLPGRDSAYLAEWAGTGAVGGGVALWRKTAKLPATRGQQR